MSRLPHITAVEAVLSLSALATAAVGPQSTIENAPGQEKQQAREAEADKIVVFILPMEGQVGIDIRHEEIDTLGEEADKSGPGQIVILAINSKGGFRSETLAIADSVFELGKRHHVVGWVRQALTSACAPALVCEGIYFTTEGVAGTNPDPLPAVDPAPAARDEHIARWVKIAQRSGYSGHLVRAMMNQRSVCSYDKDEETGEVTFYGDESGQYVLDDERHYLCFNSQTAMHCGFSKGTADTEEELIRLLDLQKPYELSDYGRQLVAAWRETCATAKREIPRLIAQLSEAEHLAPAEGLHRQIEALTGLISWWDRCPNVAGMQLPGTETLQRELAKARQAAEKEKK
jgi:hypothetical protein